MAGYSKIYVVGGLGGFMGSDGVNPIEFLLLVGDADRQWVEPHYFDKRIEPIGKLGVMVPTGANDPDLLLDACIAFYPIHFASCPSLSKVESALSSADRLDLHFGPSEIQSLWKVLREEARSLLSEMNIWQADLTLMDLQ
jgi:hypothetical protein